MFRTKYGPSGIYNQQVPSPAVLNAQKAAFFVESAAKEGEKRGQQKRGSKKKYQRLYRQEDVRRWYNNVCRGSKITADVYCRRLGHITTTWNVSAQELAKRAAKDEKWTYNLGRTPLE